MIPYIAFAAAIIFMVYMGRRNERETMKWAREQRERKEP